MDKLIDPVYRNMFGIKYNNIFIFASKGYSDFIY